MIDCWVLIDLPFVQLRCYVSSLKLEPLPMLSWTFHLPSFFLLRPLQHSHGIILSSEFPCWFFAISWKRIKYSTTISIRIDLYIKYVSLTWSSFISFSFKFEFNISCVIFCWSFNISSVFDCSSGLNVVVVSVTLSADVSFPISSLLLGTETNPRAPRLRSFSRMSMKFCENLVVFFLIL